MLPTVPGLIALLWMAQTPAGGGPPAQAACQVTGTVRADATPLPGVAITVRAGDLPVAASSTGENGAFRVRLPRAGTFTLHAELAAFAAASRDITLDADCRAQIDLVMTLASRAPTSTLTPTAATASGQAATATAARPGAPPAEGAPRAAGAAGRQAGGAGARGGAASGRRFQALGLQADAAGASLQGDDTGQGTDRDTASLPAGFSTDVATESVTTVGAGGQLNNSLLAERFAGRNPGDFGAGDNGAFRADGGAGPAGAGGRGGPGGGFGGGGFGGGGLGGGGFGGPGGFAFGGRMRNEQIRGQLSTTIADSALDAAPYSLTGAPTDKPSYFQQRYTMTLGGPFKVPGVYKGDGRTTFFLNYNGNHSATPVDVFSTVPTLAARGGDFSGSDVTLIDPATGQPFAGNVIPASRIDPSAHDLLQFIPLPNQDGDSKNFRYTTTTDVNTDDVNFRFIHSFSDPSAAGRTGAAPRGGGGRGGGRAGTNLTIGIHYRHADSDRTTSFPTVAGTSSGSAWDVPVGLSFAHDNFFHSIRLQFNRSRTDVRNLYSGTTDVAGAAGIAGVSADAFDWGLPSLSFTTISSLRDVTPSDRTDRTIGLSYSVTTTRHKHTLRAGADVRLLDTSSRLDGNANGSFIFTGIYTAPGDAIGRTTGLDVADFLLGLPQEATLQYGPGIERYRQNSWDLYFQDDWRVKSTLTVNLGVRYEYFTPYSETGNRLVTLDANQDFTAAVPVEAGGIGPFTGQFPETLVSSDNNNIAPRLGLAWKPAEKWTVRAGYGVNYVTGAYLPIAQQLAAQPPFSTAATAFGTPVEPIAIATAFAIPPQTGTQNTYGIDPDFRLGFVHIWNVDVQRDLTRTVIVGATYTGTRGGDLDIQRAPNRGPDGLTIPDVPPFIWESSPGHSLMNAVSVRVRKRQTHGFAGGASYTWSKSMDNASTIGGGTAIVAQNDQDLEAEWGLSSFDQRHRFNANASYELPFGTDGKWLTHGTAAAIAGGWMWSFDMQLASGTPFTARVLGDISDVGQGTNGSLRADTTGAPVTLDDKTVTSFFNTAAFVVPPAGQFGDAARNTIPGPGITSANMAFTRNITFAGTRGLSIRVQANNVFNTVQYLSIDTVVNSPTFGQVVAARPMRTVQIVARLRF